MRRWLGLLFVVLGSIDASNGDRSKIFDRCVTYCTNVTKTECPAEKSAFGWVIGNCFRCRYDCMWETVRIFESTAGIVPQFFGKWPFAAIVGPAGIVIQEPASTLFSLLNLVEVWRMLRKLIRADKSMENRTGWIIYAHIGMITWISSTLFHIVDCSITEKLDYFSAFAFVLSLFYVSIVYLVNMSSKFQKLLLISMTLFYLHHIYMMNIELDYSYNMTLCLTISALTTLIYVIYLVQRHRISGRLTHSDFRLLYVLLWAAGAASLEILDFSPIFWIFDSHSLFHLATVPIPSLWWQFLARTEDGSAQYYLKIA